MRMSGWKVIVWLAIAIPLVTCFGSALFSGQVLAYRDAAHFYFPLEHWLAERWGQREIPLWNSQDGNGVPVVAEATSAVFYPGKLIYALPLAFPRRMVLYVLVHLVWAAWGAYVLVRDGIHIQAERDRSWRGHGGRRGSPPPHKHRSDLFAPGLSAVAYTFGGAVLFQYSNVVFLVGAAWLPWTLWALRRMLDRRQGRWLLATSACLALTVLGGDAQTAYHAGLAGVVYGLLKRNRGGEDGERSREAGPTWVGRGQALGWLAAAAALGILLAAVQVFPTWHWTANSDRVLYSYPRSAYEIRPFMTRPDHLPIRAAIDGRADTPQGWAGAVHGLFGPPDHREHHGQIYNFSVAPWRIVECVWPNVTGRTFPENRRWLTAVDAEDRIWIPSLYFGILPLLIAVGVWSLRSNSDMIRWLSWLVLLALVASLGSYGVGRLVKTVCGTFLEKADSLPIGDGVGGLYWWMVVLLPGHAQFRYPAKLLVIATLAAAGLAGLGWQHQLTHARERLATWLRRLTQVSLVVAVAIVATGPWWQTWLAGAQPNELFGPLAVRAAWTDTWLACLHTSVICGVAWLLVRYVSQSPHLLSALLLLLTSLEIVWANGWMVQTAPATVMREQALPMLDRTCEYPTAVYRWPARTWVPSAWPRASSPNRAEQNLRWDVATLYAKLHLLGPLRSLRPHNTVAPSQYRAVLAAGGPGIPHPDALNLLGAEYVLLPQASRGEATWSRCKLQETELDDNVAMWHNGEAFPAAWIVHSCERGSFPPTTDPSAVRERARELLWPSGASRDLRHEAVVEVPDGETFPEVQTPGDRVNEQASVTRVSGNHYVVHAHLEAPGVVVWNQFFDPQWTVNVTTANNAARRSRPWRVNLIMQGVALPAGDYQLNFEYRPRDVVWGGVMSGLSWLLLVGMGVFGITRR